ncbi:MAG: cytochrome c [Trueperaceae bacterium]|nr:cytochrome c [Trueperaceae bacterium]
MVLLALALTAAAPATLPGAQSGAAAGTAHEALVETGADLYAFNCATCHGATGAGLEEARATFPADHAYCTRCHVARNPPRMSSLDMEQRQTAFSLGDPPRLDDPRALARFGTLGGLFRYVRATMPRWDPGRLSDEAYLAISVHVLERAGLGEALRGVEELLATIEGSAVDVERLDAVPLAVP